MRGGSSQDRRRARRAAERRVERAELALAELNAETADVAADEDLAAVTALAAAAAEKPAEEAADKMSGTCATCDHGADAHAGEMNDGACSMKNCSCESFTAEAAAETSILTPEAAALAAVEAAFPELRTPVDVAWAADEGFGSLVADIGDLVIDQEAFEVVDVSVALDKVVLRKRDGDTLHVAAMSISDAGDPLLADRADWKIQPSAGIGRFRLEFVSTGDVVLPDEHQAGSRLPKANPSPKPPEPTMASGPSVWEALFLPEGALTDDGRAFAPGSVEWRELPLSLMAMTETSAAGGHDGAEVAGRIDKIWRDGNQIKASGVFDAGDFGSEIARMVADGTLRGLSVDTAIHEFQVGPRGDYFNEDGTWKPENPATSGQDEPDVLDLLFGGDDADRIFVVTKAVIGMATVCPFPAFAEANISLAASGAVWSYSHQGGFIVTHAKEALVAGAATACGCESEAESGGIEGESLTAGAAGLAPLAPPAAWFEDPELEELTPLTVTDDGRIFGHAWSWETCHISFPDSCVLAPHTETENAYFHNGEIECADGELLTVGKITLDTGHAGGRASRAAAAAHYDNTGTVAAHVRSGEDKFGGWISGAVNPELSEEKLRILRASALSGDWRAVRTADGRSNLELVALLAVNVGGFPIPRPKALVASGMEGGTAEVMSLTAAGIVVERTDEDELADVAALAQRAAGDTEPVT